MYPKFSHGGKLLAYGTLYLPLNPVNEFCSWMCCDEMQRGFRWECDLRKMYSYHWILYVFFLLSGLIGMSGCVLLRPFNDAVSLLETAEIGLKPWAKKALHPLICGCRVLCLRDGRVPKTPCVMMTVIHAKYDSFYSLNLFVWTSWNIQCLVLGIVCSLHSPHSSGVHYLTSMSAQSQHCEALSFVSLPFFH